MAPSSMHPLDPLTAEEMTTAAAAVKAYVETNNLAGVRFNTITLKEPTKAALLAYASDGTLPTRESQCILQFPPTPLVVEAVVSLKSGTVTEWIEVEGVQPLATPDDCFDAEAIVKADERVVELLRARGIDDVDNVVADPWSVHLTPIEGRLIQAFMYYRSSANDNAYAHPLDFVPIVDLHLRKVVHIDEPYSSPPPFPKADVNYHRELQQQPWRQDLKPLNVVQPEGPSFNVDGNVVTWQKWSLRVGFNYREGLVLHDVKYNDGGSERPVLWRASLVEMAVPYADPAAPFVRKCAFDVGDYGLGNCANSLALGCDCLGRVHYFDALINDSKGTPVAIKKAVCLHEEDAGVLWKHMEYRTGHAEVRRSRRLVLSFVSTVVNYEYLFYWYFYQDGTISYEIKLSGELSTNMLSPGEDAANPGYGVLVAPGVNSQLHQHMFCLRLDPAVDDAQGGKGLVVSEVDMAPAPAGPDDPAGNGFVAVETPLTSEAAAQRVCDPFKGRAWKISNPASTNPITGKPVSYKLLLPANPLLLAKPESHIVKKGQFATKHLWVTPHSESETWPAGDYPLQSAGGKGLPAWTAKDRPLAGADPVLWLCFGVTHLPRVEDFPVMPAESVGFTLKPVGFFDKNPAIDIRPEVNAASVECTTNGSCTTNGVHATNGVH